MEEQETKGMKNDGGGTGGAILALLIAGVLIAALIFVVEGKAIVSAWIIAIAWGLFCIFLGIRLCFDVHAIRKHFDSKEGR